MNAILNYVSHLRRFHSLIGYVAICFVVDVAG